MVILVSACNDLYFKAELAVDSGNPLRANWLNLGFFKPWTLDLGEHIATLSLRCLLFAFIENKASFS